MILCFDISSDCLMIIKLYKGVHDEKYNAEIL